MYHNKVVLTLSVICIVSRVSAEIITAVDAFPTKFLIRTKVSDGGDNNNVNVRVILTNLHDGSRPHGEAGKFYDGPFWLDSYRNRAGGRYELAGLQPNTWYSINFTSIRRSPVYAKYNYIKIKKTPTLAGNLNEEVVNVTAIRTGEAGNILQLSAASMGDSARLFEVLVNSELICESKDAGSGQKKTVKNIILTPEQPRADVAFEIEQVHETKETGSDHVIATLKPTQCNKVCWQTWMRVSGSTAPYSEVKDKSGCKAIEETVITRSIRLFKGLTATADTLSVHTEYHSDQAETQPVVHVHIKQLNMTGEGELYWDGKGHDGRYSTSSHDGGGGDIQREFREGRDVYTVGGLRNATWYVLHYRYVIEKPIGYSSSVRRLFKTAADGATVADDDDPVDLTLTPDANGGRMRIAIERSAALSSYDVDVSVKPFCAEDGRRYRLEGNDTRVEYTLNITRALELMRERRRNATNKEHDGNATTTTEAPMVKECDRMCFSYQLILQGEPYTLAEKCRSFEKVIERSEDENNAGRRFASAVLCALAIPVYAMYIRM